MATRTEEAMATTTRAGVGESEAARGEGKWGGARVQPRGHEGGFVGG